MIPLPDSADYTQEGRMSAPVHIHTGGPKRWVWTVRRKGARKWDVHKASSKKRATLSLFTMLCEQPELVEGTVQFSQEWYDPQAVLRVRVSNR